MKRTTMVVVALLCLWIPSAASADYDTGGGGGFSGGEKGWVLNGTSMGEGKNAFLGEIGWPGLHLSVLHGMSDQLDLGGQFSFNFGYEGITDYGAAPGLRFGGILRLALMQNGNFNLGLRIDPAFALYFSTGAFGTTTFGMVIPIGVVAGISIAPQFALHFGMSIPMNIVFTNGGAFGLSILPGVGFEYKIDHALSLTFDTAFGAAINFTGGGGASFQLRALFGLAYRF